MRRKVRRPARLALPLIVKSLNEDGSYGISQASVVDTDEKLVERVSFIHERIGTAAIAEQYIEGREIYVGVLGNDRLRVLPVWELNSATWPKATGRSPPRRSSTIPTIRNAAASCTGRPKILPLNSRPASRTWRSESTGRWSSMAMPASISACADGTPYFLEANPNPEITALNILTCFIAFSR
jgi:D-alanine-D-alanine ligase